MFLYSQILFFFFNGIPNLNNIILPRFLIPKYSFIIPPKNFHLHSVFFVKRSH